jgi:hypothetical protein
MTRSIAGATLLASLIETIVGFLKDNLRGNQAAGDPPPPGKLDDIQHIIDQLTQIQLGTGNNGLVDWLAAIRSLVGDDVLRDTILVRSLQLRAPRLAEVLVMAGLVDIDFHAAEIPRAFAFRIRWDKLNAYLHAPGNEILTLLGTRVNNIGNFEIAQVLSGKLLFSPQDLLAMEYAQQGFAALPNPNANGAVDLVALVNQLIHSPLRLALPIAPPLTAQAFNAAALAGKTASDYIGLLEHQGLQALDGFGLELKLTDVAAFAAKSVDLGSGWKLSAATTGTGAQSFRLVMANGKFDLSQASGATFDVKLNWTPSGGAVVIGPVDGTRLQSGPLGLVFHFDRKRAPGEPPPKPPNVDSLFSIRATAQQLAFVIASRDLGLLAKILPLPAEIKLQTDVTIGYVQGVGLQVNAGGDAPFGVEFAVPVDLRVGSGDSGVKLDHVLARLEIAPSANDVQARVVVRLGASGRFGPVAVAVDGLGAWFGKWGNDAFGLVPPTGFSASLDAGPVSGGGFLAALPGDQFAGGLSLKVIGISVGALALFGEVDNAPAFVAVLGIRLPPPGVQIGFGFAVTGVGGVVGINRRADTDVLREQLASGTSADILFCEDPTRNGLAVINQLPRLFPAAKGVFLIGPTLQISWLELLKVDAGVFIELPGPRQIFVAGSARLVIGTESAALIYLRMDFIGGVDLTKSLIYFDAALVNSQVLQVFKITGGVALRIAYGDNGYFLLSVGGFHASFNPGGLELPHLARVGTSASVAIAWLKLENYFALTSNTFQIGAGIEVGVEIGPISAHGWFHFDALAQFDPFQFTATIDAGFDVEVEGVSLCNVRVTGTMSGPGPLVVYASASVKILFVRISKHVTVTFGDDGGVPVPAIGNLVDLISPELAKPANVRCEGDDPSVILRPNAPVLVDDTAVVGVVGAVIWEQKRVPFDVDLQRFEGTPLAPGENGVLHRLVVSGTGAVPEQDWFGVGSFMKMEDSEALNNSRFIQAQSGFRVGTGDKRVEGTMDCPIKLDLVKLPKRQLFAGLIAAGSYLSPAVAAMRAERFGNAKVVSGGPRLKASQEQWSAYDTAGHELGNGLSSTQAFQMVRGGKGVAQPSSAQAVTLQGVF